MAPVGDQPEGEEEHEAEIEEDVDDVEPLRKARNPRLPSAAEIAEHELTHILTGTGASGATLAAVEVSHTATEANQVCPSWASTTSSSLAKV